MASYETSAIASSDEEEFVPNSLGIIVTSPEPLSRDSFEDQIEDIYHPLLDPGLWSFPTIHAACHVNSTPREYDPDSLHTLVTVAQDLVDRGAVVIVTSTGFSSMQRDMVARLSVPVLCSAMVQLASLKLISSGGVGVVTLDRQLVSSWNLVAIGAAPDTPVIGLSPSSLWRQDFDCSGETSRLLYDLVEACEELIRRHNVTVIVLEEPRFARYTSRIQERLKGVRLFDIVTAVKWLYSGHIQSGRSPGLAGGRKAVDRGDSAGKFARRRSQERPEDASIIGESPIMNDINFAKRLNIK